MGYQVRFAFWWFTLAAVGRGAILFIFLDTSWPSSYQAFPFFSLSSHLHHPSSWKDWSYVDKDEKARLQHQVTEDGEFW